MGCAPLPPLVKSLTALGQRIGCQLGYFLEDLFTLSFTFFGLGFRTGSPAGQGFLGSSHMADNLLPQRTCPTAKRSHRLVQDPDIGGIGDMGFQGRRVDANPPRFNRSMLDQMTDQLLVKIGNPLLAEPLVELDQRGGSGTYPSKTNGRNGHAAASQLDLNLLVPQSPAELKIHHPKVNPRGRPGSTHTLVEDFFKRLEQRPLAQKLVDFLELLVQLIQTRIDEAVTKTHLLRYCSAHVFFYINPIFIPKNFLTFSVRTI